MEDQNYIPYYFIDNVEITPELLTIVFNKDYPAYFFNEADELPVVKIEIANPDFTGSAENLKEQIDFYDDGIIFDFLEDKNGRKALLTTDISGSTFTISGTDIKRQDLPYNKDQLWTAIKHYKQHLESSNKSISDLTDKIEAVKRYADKEINNADKVLATLPDPDSRRQRWTAKRDTWQTVVNLLK